MEKNYKSITYTVGGEGGKVVLTEFLNDSHTIQLDCIDEAQQEVESLSFDLAFYEGKITNLSYNNK